MPLGPFDITATRIVALGTRFTEFVQRLLDVEMRAHSVAGHLLTYNIVETTADGGVDAATRQAPSGSDWLPPGDTAWQFKRYDLYPEACAAELTGARWAREMIQAGASYVMVLGSELTDQKIAARQKKLADKAVELRLIREDQRARIRVYDANQLARWASRFPSLAVSRLSGGPGSSAIDFDSWSGKGTYRTRWTPDSSREAAASSIRVQIAAPGPVELRVQGPSGIGKTRLVLEALRDEGLRGLVAYVDDERFVDGQLIEHLIEDGRTAILVVDECAAARHVKLRDKLPADSAVKLITIGDAGAAATRSPIVGMAVMPAESTDEFLRFEYPQFGPEARRFITDHGQGYMRWTIVLADRLRTADSAQAADLIARDDIEQFITDLLPGGQDFFCATILALLERVGWDGELRYQLETLARFAGVDVETLERAGRELEERGLLIRQGRYRAITPHPLAVMLAADAWTREGGRIIPDLLPELDQPMALSLFGRVAQLGSFQPATAVLPLLLSSDGPFSSLAEIESRGISRLTIQLAIVLPDEMTTHLGELIEGAPLAQLQRLLNSKQDLIWALEKLVWHRRTFEKAANSLLRLALSESQADRNAPATRAWLDLFGSLLPATAAPTAQRSRYLEGVSADPDSGPRLLAARAAARVLVPHETVAVSGELQGGVLVEPRGAAETYEELADYRRAAIGVLSRLRHDPQPDVAETAETVLLDAMQYTIADESVGDALADVLLQFGGAAQQRLRQRAEHLLSLFERHRQDDAAFIDKVQSLLTRLPALSGTAQIEFLAHIPRWDLEEGELQRRLHEALSALSSPEDRAAVLGLLTEELPAAWELGYTLATILGESPDVVNALTLNYRTNPEAILGFLASQVQNGDEQAFDRFLEGDSAQHLDLRSRLRISARGPASPRARERIMAGLSELSVLEGTATLFGWHRNVTADEALTLIADWSSRISSQLDYNALIDWISSWLLGQEVLADELQDLLWTTLAMRAHYPDVGQRQWAWSQLAGKVIARHCGEVARLILDLVQSQSVMISAGHDEADVLRASAAAHPQEVWEYVAAHLMRRSWRVQMEVRGWLVEALPSETVTAWVGTDLERARLVASIASPGGDEPTPVARFLLTEFGTDDQIRSSLWGQFISGFWWGPESEHIAGQIGQLRGWRQRSSEPLAVREWAREMITYLDEQRQRALEREAEERF